ncbi:porin family protein [Paracoccus sp. M683]|uniref:outer membrane protein n=1 Tax=Paracoccus sp. M683 TaxID=2594268 RepID=UPI00117D23EC|nr:porin family protein [Paracoccus sp. M683]TRW97468.1 porin family protein [Paracoccus sp. M683]
MKLALAAIAATLTAGSAFAGGYVAPVVETAPVVAAPVIEPQTGDWTGFYAGLQYGKGNAEFTQGGASIDSDYDAYGIHGGYLHDFGSYVLGGELDYNKADIDDVDDKADLVRLRARAGYDMGRFLPYVTIGAAHISADNVSGIDVSETGLTYGIGGEFKVTDRVSLGAEYTRSDFSDVDDIDGLDLDTDLVQVRASFHF